MTESSRATFHIGFTADGWLHTFHRTRSRQCWKSSAKRVAGRGIAEVAGSGSGRTSRPAVGSAASIAATFAGKDGTVIGVPVQRVRLERLPRVSAAAMLLLTAT